MNAVDQVLGGRAQRLIARAGITAWSTIGLVGVTAIVLTLLSAISSVVLPLLFAAVLAVLFRPVAAWLEARGLRPTLAAGAVVIGCVVAVAVVVVLAVTGVLDQTAQIGGQVEEALTTSGLDEATADDLQDAVESLSPVISEGVGKIVIGGIGRLAGFAAGAVLGVLIMYYLIKDGGSIRRSMVGSLAPVHRPTADELIDDASHVLRKYGRGRTTLSALVALAVGAASLLMGLPLVLTVVIVNFVGGYVPYIGAVVGGGLAISVALADGGVTSAIVMLVVVLGANLLLENIVEPKVMGRTLDIHPLLVLIVTAIGGIVGGLVGLILAVPFTVITLRALSRARPVDAFQDLAGRARPAVETLLSGREPIAVDDGPDIPTSKPDTEEPS
jgi:predicted PurR-regulated permease PerM